MTSSVSCVSIKLKLLILHAAINKFCHFSASISSRYKVSKYPTLKLIRNGIPVKKEYRGARTSDAFLEYIKQQLANPLKEFTNLQELVQIDDVSSLLNLLFLEASFWLPVGINFILLLVRARSGALLVT